MYFIPSSQSRGRRDLTGRSCSLVLLEAAKNVGKLYAVLTYRSLTGRSSTSLMLPAPEKGPDDREGDSRSAVTLRESRFARPSKKGANSGSEESVWFRAATARQK